MGAEPPILRISDIAEGGAALQLDKTGRPISPVALVDLDTVRNWHDPIVGRAIEAIRRRTGILLGIAHHTPHADALPLARELTCTLITVGDRQPIPSCYVDVDDPYGTATAVATSASRAPLAAVTLADLLRVTSRLGVRDGLLTESLAYSMLLAGPEFRAWRAQVLRRPVPDVEAPVLVERDAALLRIVLNRPERHNAFGRAVRDALLDALAVAELDRTISAVELSGNGPSFCSGGDLDEFGTAPDVSRAHLIRLQRSAGLAVHRIAGRLRAVVHGACIGAGIEVPAFAGRVAARPDAYFQLPELRMGLVPGAGGTVSIPRRIGSWRTAYLALHGEPVDVGTALRWGLVDEHA